MEISPGARPPVEVERATLFVALELSKSTWLVALYSPAADKISQHRVDGGDAKAPLSLIARKRERAEGGARPIRARRVLL